MPRSMKKSRSDASVLPMRSNEEPVDARRFYIKKKTRFATRGFQILNGCLLVAFLFKQDPEISSYGLHSGVQYAKALGFGTIFVAIAGVALYGFPIFLKWTSKRLITLETFMDVVIFGSLLLSFITLLSTAKAGTTEALCPPGKSAACDTFNWALVFQFIQIALWAGSIGMDLKAIKLGIWPENPKNMESELDALKRRPSVRV